MMLSHDGYIRLSFVNLASLSFLHIVSALDEELTTELLLRAVPASVAGYTEWISQTDPCITLGWDWYRDAVEGRFMLADLDVRSNIMLVDSRGYDLGMAATASRIAVFLNTLNWESFLPESIPIYH